MYRRAIYITVAGIIGIFIFALVFLLPKADPAAVRTSLSITAQILGVLLGAVLVVVWLLIEKSQRSEELLRRAFRKYRRLIDNRFKAVLLGLQELIRQAKDGAIRLNEPIFLDRSGNPANSNYGDVISSLYALAVIMRGPVFDDIEKDLDELGYSEKERDEILYRKGFMLDDQTTGFLRLIEDALDLNCIAPQCSNEVSDVAVEVFDGYNRDGVCEAFLQLERSRKVLGSRILAVCVSVIALTAVGSVLSILGITNTTIAAPMTSSDLLTLASIVMVLSGFILSVVLALFLIEKIIS